MQLSAELSLYPLAGKIETPINTFIEGLCATNDLSVVTNSMSTQIHGDASEVFSAIQSALALSYSKYGQQVLVAKFLPEHQTQIQPKTMT